MDLKPKFEVSDFLEDNENPEVVYKVLHRFYEVDEQIHYYAVVSLEGIDIYLIKENELKLYKGKVEDEN